MGQACFFFLALPFKTMKFVIKCWKGVKLAKKLLAIAFCTNALMKKETPVKKLWFHDFSK